MPVRFSFAVSAILTFSLISAAAESNQRQLRDLLERGFEYHRQGDYVHSIPLLERAQAIEPRDYHANLLLGIDLLRTGKRAEAVRFLEAAAREQPKDEIAYEYLGEAQASLARYAEAAAAYGEAVQLAPGSSDSAMAFVDFSLERFRTLARELRSSSRGLAAEYRLQARAYRPADASRRKLLQNAADMDGDAPGVWSELALAEIAGGELEKARRHVARAKEKNASDLRAYGAEALLAAYAGQWLEANELLNEIGRRSPGVLVQTVSVWPRDLQAPAGTLTGAAANAYECIQNGSRLCHPSGFGQRVKAPARPLFMQQRWEALASLPAPVADQKQQWYFRGTAFAQLNDCGRAIPALERSLNGLTDRTDARFLLSWCYAQRVGEVAKAVEEAGADAGLVHMLRGDVLFRLQDKPAAAITEYRTALVARPDELSVRERLAEAELSAGEIEEARKSARAVMAVNPQRPSAKRTLAEIAMRERDYARALPYLRDIVAKNPSDVAARAELGTACAQAGSFEEALHNLAAALREGYPDERGTLHYQLATVLRRLGRAAESERAFETARELSDTFERRSHREQDAVF